jgi:hypothetical protein
MPHEFSISQDDFTGAARLNAKTSLRSEIVFLFIGVAFAIFAYVTKNPHLRYAAIGGIVGGLTFGLLFQFVVVPGIARWQYKRHESVHQKTQIRVGEDGVSLKSNDWEGTLRWNVIHRWRQNDHFILLYPAPGIYYIIPKRLQNEGFEISGLLSRLATHVGKAT